jgi:hypothetical protein
MIVHSPDDSYSITSFGKVWVAATTKRLVSDPGRFTELVEKFVARFGSGFLQRAAEASACYRTANYLACCALAGAAAESILLSLAIAKSAGNEAQVLSTYRSAGGRRKITDRVLGNVPGGIAEQVRTASNVLHFWRDETTHGTPTTISEIEAYWSLGQLLRFGQLADDNWATLVS